MKDRSNKNTIYSKYDGYQRGLASMVCKCFDKHVCWTDFLSGSVVRVNKALAQELHKPLI